jgi:hypothetical protein
LAEKLKISTEMRLSEDANWSNILPIDNSIAEQLMEGKDRRIICHIKGIKPFHCALLPDGNNGWFILLNKNRQKELNLVHGDRIQVQLEKDHSEYGMEMPIELREVLDQDEHADYLFHKLTPGRMRNIIHAVSSVKSSDIRIRKALVYAEHLKKNKGKIEYKELAAEMKEANQQAKHFRG